MQTTIISSEILFTSTRWDANFFFKSEEALFTKYEQIKLSEIVKERKGFLEPQSYPQHVFNYVGLENISQKTRVLTDFKPKYGNEIKSRSKIFRKGDILYGRMRPTLNKVLRIDGELTEGICSSEIFVLSPVKDVVNPFFLEEILGSRWVQSEIERIVGGATMPRINIKDFLNIRVPLPPIDRQNEIAQFIQEERAGWMEELKKVKRTPSLIMDIVMNSLNHDLPLELDITSEKLLPWNNPLPDTELLS